MRPSSSLESAGCLGIVVPVLKTLGWIILLWQSATTATAVEQLIRTNQPGRMIAKENQVEYFAAGQPPLVAPMNQWLAFDDTLRTLALSRATVRLADWKQVMLRDRSRFEVVRQPTATNSPMLRLHEGELYLSRGGGVIALPIEAAGTRGTPKGTEFLVSVVNGSATFTMFDGEVELSNDATPRAVPVRAGEQGIAEPGQPIRVRPILEARNIVQWWLYYPAVLDLADLPFTREEVNLLSASLTDYRSGNLARALQSYPGFPNPTDPASDAQRCYLSSLLLSVGSVDRASSLLFSVTDSNFPPALALAVMIHVVKGADAAAAIRSMKEGNRELSSHGEGRPIAEMFSQSPSLLLALSYAHQSTNNLTAALEAARAATALSRATGGVGNQLPTIRSEERTSSTNGFAWTRVAELEFSFGRTHAAREAVLHSLKYSPSNAQAHCVHGFLLAAAYKQNEALAAFARAIDLDPFLANAWLGRGLVKRRMGSLWKPWNREKNLEDATWLADLQTAAAVEPRRSLVRAYAGKAFSDSGRSELALKELAYAALLDPSDPTPFLYEALELRQQNRPNESVRELEHSVGLNDNRAVYRSRLLLDQDHATRSASLAKIYQDAGLEEVALREAARAVSYDYTSHSAHQFLAESYNALRDPTRFNLRYETVWFNELLLANILSPVGGGLLSQNISQQEYSSLFEANRVGISTSTEYRSDGQLREIASHYGLLGRTAYTLDLDYQQNRGVRPNNDLNRIEWYGQLKHQLNDRDSVFLLTKYQDYKSGDNFQHYDPNLSSRTLRIQDDELPIVLGAWHREWLPSAHTTILAGHLASDQGYALEEASQTLPRVQVNELVAPGISMYEGWPFPTLRYRSRFSAEMLEANHVQSWEKITLVAGARNLMGQVRTSNEIDTSNPVDANFFKTPILTSIRDGFGRASQYGYGIVQPVESLQITAGLTHDWLRYPANFRIPPISDGTLEREQWSPKAGFQWDLSPSLTLRGIYAHTLGGVSFEESVRLEPTQIAGFAQSFRSVISEAEAGSVTAPRYKVSGAGLDWKAGYRLHAGLRWERIGSEVDQDIGAFLDPGTGPTPRPSRLKELIDYREDSIHLHTSILLSDGWSFTGRYRVTWATAGFNYPDVPMFVNGAPIAMMHPAREELALLHEFGLRCLYQHPNGFFTGSESVWYLQRNSGYPNSIHQTARFNDSVYQLNVAIGWRVWRRRAELSLAGLNMTDSDYRLNSLTAYQDLPRERVLALRLRVNW